uniref:N6-adenine methyltransferase n=1 Tax=Odontella aurita TaxID=265563 RepID=A0A7S4J2M5_9STRA|mmetsp:Transcript_36776/g.110333  ORF Transcript_36776/g.110333 Transcript_36776/m.110333 type:complete len:186 (+) Transcript_36776:121-678(+)
MSARHMFADEFIERHDLEQYFWSEATVLGLQKALGYHEDVCCLTTPSLAHAWHEDGREEVLLDLDERFDYLPRFRRFDLRSPEASENENFRVVVVDPPFFYIPMRQIRDAVLTVTRGRTDLPLLIGFLRREEASLMDAFKDFGLRRTKFNLEYATVKPNKWANYALYSNIDLPGIKRLTEKHMRK